MRLNGWPVADYRAADAGYPPLQNYRLAPRSAEKKFTCIRLKPRGRPDVCCAVADRDWSHSGRPSPRQSRSDTTQITPGHNKRHRPHDIPLPLSFKHRASHHSGIQEGEIRIRALDLIVLSCARPQSTFLGTSDRPRGRQLCRARDRQLHVIVVRPENRTALVKLVRDIWRSTRQCNLNALT